MKNIFFICSLSLFALGACSDDENALTIGDGGNYVYPQQKPNSLINEKLFDVINLDYPGLEKVKAHYEDGNLYYAADALLKYYQTRTNVPTNPLLNLMNVTVTEDDKTKADQALEYRFYVRNFTDTDGLPYKLNKQDGKLNWDNRPSGVSDEYPKQLHRHQWFIPQAKLYRTSNDEKYIQSWIEVYSDWILQNPKPEEEVKDIKPWWQLQTASRLADQVELFEYYKNSINFTPDWLSIFLSSFADHCDYLAQYRYSEGGNVLATQGRALVFAGTLYPEFKNSQKWTETGFSYIGNQFLNDGMHEELDLSYHIDVVNTCCDLIKLIDANNLNNQFASNIKNSLERAGSVIVQFTYPNYFEGKNFSTSDYTYRKFYVPGFNDTRQTSWNRSVLNKNFNTFYDLFPNNEEFKYMAGYGKSGGTCPNIEPTILKNSGYYIFRNGWTKSSTVMILSNNNSGDAKLQAWSHNQPDNGTFELYHNERNFFPDSGVRDYYSWSESEPNKRRATFRQSKMHNTLTLAGNNFTTTKGQYISSGKIDNAEVVVFENAGYPNLTHRRYVFFVEKKFFVIVDEGIGEGTQEEAVQLHFNLCDGSDSEVIVETAKRGARTNFSDQNNILVRTVYTNDNNNTTTIKDTYGEVSYNTIDKFTFSRPAYHLSMDKGDRTAARFLSVIYPTTEPTENINITGSMDDTYNPNGVSNITININDTSYELSYTIK